MISVVVKAFEGPDGMLDSGTVVDSTSWRNEGRLLNCRFIRAANDDEIASFSAGSTAPGTTAKTSKAKTSSPTTKKTTTKKGTQTRS